LSVELRWSIMLSFHSPQFKYMNFHIFTCNLKLKVHVRRSRGNYVHLVWGAELAQWWQRSPSTNVSRVICRPLSLLVLYSAPRGFSSGTQVFPSPQKPTFDLIDLIYSLPN